VLSRSNRTFHHSRDLRRDRPGRRSSAEVAGELPNAARSCRPRVASAKQRQIIHNWLTIFWLSIGLATWIVLGDALRFVGFMSLYAIWITHLAGWAAETPVE
jgi:hypothetical protein